MRPEEQTEAVLVELYQLTLMFTRKYVHRYYKQYRGELEDLASEMYISFTTRKSREKGKEESLLDKFNPAITTLPYLVKVSVQRKLIDFSRQDQRTVVSIDKCVDEFGDLLAKVFNLVTGEQDVTIDNMDVENIRTKAVAKFRLMSEKSQKSIRRQYHEVQNVLSPSWQSLFDEVTKEIQLVTQPLIRYIAVHVNGDTQECPVQQITSKTICVLVGMNVFDFNKETGQCRQSDTLFIPNSTLELLSTAPIEKPKIHRKEFYQYIKTI